MINWDSLRTGKGVPGGREAGGAECRSCYGSLEEVCIDRHSCMPLKLTNHRVTSENSDTVDLHGTTVAEAITIVKEILNDEASSISQGRLKLKYISVDVYSAFTFSSLLHLCSVICVLSRLFLALLAVHLCAPCLVLSGKAKPMKIITGRGTHSVNQVGVLKPAVKKALVQDGWIVGSWDGGLIVRQRQK